jgi:acyl-CoA reductase-like NAD-dependent aldehyde dehydrogenase
MAQVTLAPPPPAAEERLVEALGPSGRYAARTRTPIRDLTGAPVAQMCTVPALYVRRALAALRAARPLPPAGRVAALARAADLFTEATLGGFTPDQHEVAVSRVSGVPISVVRQANRVTAARLRGITTTLDAARPGGAGTDWREPGTRRGTAVWSRRGEVFAVHASGVHPGAHGLWPEALAQGYRVAVRPNRREPLTPYRLVLALRAAGFGDDHVALLPSESEAARTIVQEADLAYGGDEVIRAVADEAGVLPQVPGRSKILLGADVDWRECLDTIVSSVSAHGGAGCVNATALLVEGDADRTAQVAEAVAERLAQLPSLPPDDERAVLPVQPVAAARALERFLRSRADGARAWLGGDGVVDQLPGGAAVLRPAVHQVPHSGHPGVGTELPFPCLWVAPWSRAEGVAAVHDTLTLTVISGAEDLIDELAAAPTVGNLHIGRHPTHWTDVGIPHDGWLSDFLMRSRAVIRD